MNPPNPPATPPPDEVLPADDLATNAETDAPPIPFIIGPHQAPHATGSHQSPNTTGPHQTPD